MYLYQIQYKCYNFVFKSNRGHFRMLVFLNRYIKILSATVAVVAVFVLSSYFDSFETHSYRSQCFSNTITHANRVAHNSKISIPRLLTTKTRYMGSNFEHDLSKSFYITTRIAVSRKNNSSNNVCLYYCAQHAFYLRGPPVLV